MAESIAVITGVSKGLGEALAHALLDRDWSVVGIGRSAPPALTDAGLELVVADLAQSRELPGVVDELFAKLASRSPSSIAVVNNAAVAFPADLVGAIDPGELGQSLAVNLQAPAIIANAFVRHFARGAGDRRLINVSSGAGVRPLIAAAAYCMGKAGIEMLTQVVAAEAGDDGITAITIRPGIIDTPMQELMRGLSPERVPSVTMFREFHDSGQLVAPEVTAETLVDRLILTPVENGRAYSYGEL